MYYRPDFSPLRVRGQTTLSQGNTVSFIVFYRNRNSVTTFQGSFEYIKNFQQGSDICKIHQLTSS